MTQHSLQWGAGQYAEEDCLKSERKVVAAGNGSVGAEMSIKEVRSDLTFWAGGRGERDHLRILWGKEGRRAGKKG